MKIPVRLAKYISKNFIMNCGIVFAVMAGIIVLFDTLEMVKRTNTKDVPFRIIMELVLLKFPSITEEVLPFTILLGGILTFTKLTRSSELVVTRAAGVSVWQFLMPPVVISFAVGVFIMTIFNPLSAIMLSRFEKVEARYFSGVTSMLSISSTGLWLKQSDDDNGKAIIHALRVSNEDMHLYDVTFYIFDKDENFIKRVDAKEAILEEGYWKVKRGILTVPGKPAEHHDEYVINTNLSRSQIQESFAPPETMSFWELPGFIATLQEAGFSALRHSLHFQNLVVTPFLFSVMILFSAAFSLRQPRQGKTGVMMAAGIGTGLAIRFISDLVGAVGLSGKIPIALAAWSPVAISIFLGMAILLHMEDG